MFQGQQGSLDLLPSLLVLLLDLPSWIESPSLFHESHCQLLFLFIVKFTQSLKSSATVILPCPTSPIARWGLAILSCIILIHVCNFPPSSRNQHQNGLQFRLVLLSLQRRFVQSQGMGHRSTRDAIRQRARSAVKVRTKNEHANFDQINEVLDAAEVIRLPNIG